VTPGSEEDETGNPVTQAKSAVVVGAQWGDEGKGKIVDVLSEPLLGVARYAGGHNAGHTVVINGRNLFCNWCRAACCGRAAAG